jgi:NADH-quinone oxidoreductase subunit A
MLNQYIPIMMHLLVAISFATITLLMSVWLGRKAKTRSEVKDSPYECGMIPIGEAQPRFSIKFYIVAMLFVLFDIEVVFLYPWAVVFQDFLAADTRLVFWSFLGFVGILFVAYLYALRKQALSWVR